MVAAGTVASLDAANTTLSAGAAIDDTTLSVAAASNFVSRRRYWIANAHDQKEHVLVLKVDTSANVLTLSEGLEYAYATSDAVYSNRITYAVAAGVSTPRQRNCEARFVYAIAGVTYRVITMWDVVRQKWPDALISTGEFRQLAGELAADVYQDSTQRGEDFREAIATATTRMLTDIRRRTSDNGIQIEPDLFKSFQSFKEPVAERVIYDRARRGFQPPDWDAALPFVEFAEAEYERALDAALDTTDSYDADDSGTVPGSERTARPAAIRFVQ